MEILANSGHKIFKCEFDTDCTRFACMLVTWHRRDFVIRRSCYLLRSVCVIISSLLFHKQILVSTEPAELQNNIAPFVASLRSVML